jgi:hypothetical protein
MSTSNQSGYCTMRWAIGPLDGVPALGVNAVGEVSGDLR